MSRAESPKPAMRDPGSYPSGREGIALALLLLIALGVRVAGTGSDLPYVYHWDEPTPVNLAVWMHTERSLDPQFFHYPGGLTYLLAAEYAIVRVGGRLLGEFESDADVLQWMSAGTPPRPPGGGVAYFFPTQGVSLLYLLGRWTVAILGTLTIYWAFVLGSRTAGPFAAWLAAGLLALSEFHARHSSLVTTDVPCAAFLTWFLVEIVTRRSWIRAGIALGLAAAFKYSGGIGVYLWPLGILALVLSARGPLRGSLRATLRSWNGFWIRLSPVAAGVFLALDPYVLITPARFLRDFFYEARHMRGGTGHFAADVGAGDAGVLVVGETLLRFLGPLLLVGLVMSVIAGVVMVRRSRSRIVKPLPVTRATGSSADESVDSTPPGDVAKPLMVLGSPLWLVIPAFCLSNLVQLSSWGTVYDRYLLPVWPVLVVLAASGWNVVLGRLASRGHPRVAIAVALVLLAWQLPNLTRSVAARSTPDPRVAMTRWIERNVDRAASIATEAGGPLIDASDRAVLPVDLLGRSTLTELQRDGVRYLVSTAREDMLPSSAPESLRTRKNDLLAICREVWRFGKYAIYEVPVGDSALLDAQRAVQEQKFAEALHITQVGLERDPENGLLWLWRGQALQGIGDSTAVEAYDRARQLRPTDPVPLYALGNLELNARRWERAFTAFAEAGRIAPKDPIALLNQSTALGYWAEEIARSDSLQAARRMMDDALVRARAAAVLAQGSPEFTAQEARLRRIAERAGIPPE